MTVCRFQGLNIIPWVGQRYIYNNQITLIKKNDSTSRRRMKLGMQSQGFSEYYPNENYII